MIGLLERKLRQALSARAFDRRLLISFAGTEFGRHIEIGVTTCLQSKIAAGGVSVSRFEIERCASKQSSLDATMRDTIVNVVEKAIGGIPEGDVRQWNGCYEQVTGLPSTLPPPTAAPGCSDGTREALTDVRRYPRIAACGATWRRTSLLSPRTGASCGGSNGCAAPADACAANWHVCKANDLRRYLTPEECDALSPGEFVAASGDQVCAGCGIGGGNGAVCCGRGCVLQNGSCVWPGRTAWMGMIDGHIEACGDIEMLWDPGRYGLLCCQD